jgi:GT2 family glycosyltransferase
VVADNGSSDASLEILEELSRRDPDAKILANRANYGPEASVVNALEIAESLVTARPSLQAACPPWALR